MHKLCALLLLLTLAALAEPPKELHLSAAVPGQTLLARVNAAATPAPTPTPAVTQSVPVSSGPFLQLQFFRYGPGLGASFRL